MDGAVAAVREEHLWRQVAEDLPGNSRCVPRPGVAVYSPWSTFLHATDGSASFRFATACIGSSISAQQGTDCRRHLFLTWTQGADAAEAAAAELDTCERTTRRNADNGSFHVEMAGPTPLSVTADIPIPVRLYAGPGADKADAGDGRGRALLQRRRHGRLLLRVPPEAVAPGRPEGKQLTISGILRTHKSG